MRMLATIALAGALAAPALQAQHISEKYDDFTGRTTSVARYLYDSPMMGPVKKMDIVWSHPGQGPGAADTVFIVVTFRFVDVPGAMSDGETPVNPPLQFKLDDTAFVSFPPSAADPRLSLLGTSAVSREVAYGYVVPMDAFRRIASSAQVAFRVGPWTKRLSDKDLSQLQTIALRAQGSAG